MKAIVGKSYGSIPHLIGSKLGDGDHHIHQGQHDICTVKTRDKHDIVIVQEKYDGANVGVANINGEIVAISRSGYTAKSSPYIQHHYFSDWVERNKARFERILKPGVRICGEWMIQAHGIKYAVKKDPFVAFDIIENKTRLTFFEFQEIVERAEFLTPMNLWCACSSVSIESVTQFSKEMEDRNFIGERKEGFVYRVERKGNVDFLAKYVYSDFVPGKYLPGVGGETEIYNIDTKELLK